MSWHSSWLNGKAPKDLALSLYPLAWRKKRSFRDDVTNHNFTRGLWTLENGISTANGRIYSSLGPCSAGSAI
jgi:hypothetical protein